jgi:hypothetical protein
MRVVNMMSVVLLPMLCSGTADILEGANAAVKEARTAYTTLIEVGQQSSATIAT